MKCTVCDHECKWNAFFQRWECPECGAWYEDFEADSQVGY